MGYISIIYFICRRNYSIKCIYAYIYTYLYICVYICIRTRITSMKIDMDGWMCLFYRGACVSVHTQPYIRVWPLCLSLAGQPKVAPTITLFPPSKEELNEATKATLVCLINDFYPSPVTVDWVIDGSTRSGETTAPQRQSNSQYMASSYLSLSASDWSSHETYTCRVTHNGTSITKTLKRSEC